MAGIHIFAFLVACAPGLLACEQISTHGMEWNTMPECEAELQSLVRRHSGDGNSVVMAKCQYVMDGPAKTEWQLAGRMGGRYHGF
jgi:hypothetical protein